MLLSISGGSYHVLKIESNDPTACLRTVGTRCKSICPRIDGSSDNHLTIAALRRCRMIYTSNLLSIDLRHKSLISYVLSCINLRKDKLAHLRVLFVANGRRGMLKMTQLLLATRDLFLEPRSKVRMSTYR